MDGSSGCVVLDRSAPLYTPAKYDRRFSKKIMRAGFLSASAHFFNFYVNFSYMRYCTVVYVRGPGPSLRRLYAIRIVTRIDTTSRPVFDVISRRAGGGGPSRARCFNRKSIQPVHDKHPRPHEHKNIYTYNTTHTKEHDKTAFGGVANCPFRSSLLLDDRGVYTLPTPIVFVRYDPFRRLFFSPRSVRGEKADTPPRGSSRCSGRRKRIRLLPPLLLLRHTLSPTGGEEGSS